MLQSEMPLLTMLQACADRDSASFHTPGHKRGQGLADPMRSLLQQAYTADLPELPELDNLLAPQHVIQQAQALAAKAFGAEKTWFLANGSTSGVIAAILAICQPGDQIILPRNVHQSAISGLILAGVMPIFILPDYDAERDIAQGLGVKAIAQALENHSKVKAILLVSPTYYGICSDVACIAKLAHDRQIPIIVDEAHGSHFQFHPALPKSALSQGVDVVIQSTHKTLSGLTQASMLHCQGSRVNRDRISQALQLVQSTSPNYLLLASLDAARWQMVHAGKALLDRALQLAERARSQLAQIPHLSLLNAPSQPSSSFHALDPLRLTVTVTQLSLDGFKADEILHDRFGVTCELPTRSHLTFIITHGNTESDIDRLIQAWKTLAQEFPHPLTPLPQPASDRTPTFQPELVMSPREAFFAPTKSIAIAAAVDHISAELICPYPPGIPILMPGERITQAAIDRLQHTLAIGGCITGAADPSLQFLQVVA